jgi:hypothetical protein
LRPLLVVNPYAEHLTFLDDRTRLRRDHLKYLTLIRAVALLHQYQRPLRRGRIEGQQVEYIEVELSDIRVVNRLAHEVLGRSLDELSPQTRRLLLLIEAMVSQMSTSLRIERAAVRFTQRQVREATGWSPFQVKEHLGKLAELEYVLVHRASRGQSFVYELFYGGEGQDGRPFLMGLIELDKLTEKLGQLGYDQKREEHNGPWEGPGRGQGATREPRGSAAPTGAEPASHRPSQPSEPPQAQNAHLDGQPTERSYTHSTGRNGTSSVSAVQGASR